ERPNPPGPPSPGGKGGDRKEEPLATSRSWLGAFSPLPSEGRGAGGVRFPYNWGTCFLSFRRALAMRTDLRRFSLVLALALLVAAPLRAEVVARQGDCWLEKVQDQQVLHLKGSYHAMGLAHGKLLAQAIAEDAEAFLDHWCV